MTKYKLGDVCEIFGRIGFRGYTAQDLVESPKDGAITLSPTNIVNGELDFTNSTYLSWDKYEESPEIKINENDIVVVKTASVGKCALVRKLPHPTTLNPQFVVLKKIQADPVYLSYIIKGKCFQSSLKAITAGSVVPTLSQKHMADIEIYLPDLKIQKKIASVLSALDDKIALNKKMNQKLEAMAKRLYDYWFVQYDFPDKNGHPYKTTGGPMTYNQILKREIPERWEVKTLADFAEYVKTTTKFDKAFNYVSTDNMMPQKQGLSGENLKPASGNILCYEKGDILISNIRPYFKKIWYADQSGTCSTDVLCIRSLKSDNSYFVYKTLWQDDFFDYVMQGAKGSKMPRGDKTRIMNYPICIAQENFDELIKKFSALVVPMQAVIQRNTKEITHLTKLRDKLLPLLMNGQVTVA